MLVSRKKSDLDLTFEGFDTDRSGFWHLGMGPDVYTWRREERLDMVLRELEDGGRGYLPKRKENRGRKKIHRQGAGR